MIASWRGLAVVAAIALVLAVAVAIDVTRTRRAVDRQLVPGFDPDRVTELVWERPGRPAIRVVRDGGTWRLRSPDPATPSAGTSSAPADPAADPSAVSDVLAALRGARWHRRGAATLVHATLTVVSGSARHALAIGEPIAGTDQIWIVTGEQGVVVDSWVARALDRDLLALRLKAPFAEVAGAQAIEIANEVGSRAGLRVTGHPRRLAAPVQLVLADDVAGGLERALREIVIVRIPDSPVAGHGLAITAGDELATPGRTARLSIGGSCPGAPALVAVSGSTGEGCIEAAAAVALERALAGLRQPPAAIVERRPVPSSFEVTRIVLVDGVALDTVRLQLAGAPADSARVTELLAALAAPAEATALPVHPAADHLVVSDRSGTAITLDLFAERVVARHGEPIALRPAPGFWSLLVRPSRELRDVAPWLEEPTTITALRIDGVRYQRGAVIGEWTRQPPTRAIDGEALEALVATLAAPRSLGFVDDRIAIAHRVALEITAPVGAATEHTLEIGSPRAAGCPVRVAREAFLLPATVCAQVAVLAK